MLAAQLLGTVANGVSERLCRVLFFQGVTDLFRVVCFLCTSSSISLLFIWLDTYSAAAALSSFSFFRVPPPAFDDATPRKSTGTEVEGTFLFKGARALVRIAEAALTLL